MFIRDFTIEEMKKWEHSFFQESGISEDIIIENVGIEGSSFIHDKVFEQKTKRPLILLFIGKGNNGADGVAIARHLFNKYDYNVLLVTLFREDEFSQPLVRQLKIVQSFGIPILSSNFFSSEQNTIAIIEMISKKCSSLKYPLDNILVIDAIFGSGIKKNKKIDEALIELMRKLQEERFLKIISIDLPSWDLSKTESLSPFATLFIGSSKLSNFSFKEVEKLSHCLVLQSGFPKKCFNNLSFDTFLEENHKVWFQNGSRLKVLKTLGCGVFTIRRDFSHKNCFGHLLILGGSPGMEGAAILAQNAALRLGVGLVSSLTWQESYPCLSTNSRVEALRGIIPYDESKGRVDQSWIESLNNKYDAILAGPGLGNGPSNKMTRNLILSLVINYRGPLILDADAINSLSYSADKKLLKSRKGPLLLTPHPYEWSKLNKTAIDSVLKDPLKLLLEWQNEFGANISILLKNACSLLSVNGNKIIYFNFPNSLLAKAGSGDVLAGIISALSSQTKEVQRSSFLGLNLHSLSASYLRKRENSFTPMQMDIIEEISSVIKKIS